jgi:hypothetical protein
MTKILGNSPVWGGGVFCVASISEEAVLHAQLWIYFIRLISRPTLNIFLRFFSCPLPEFLRVVFPKVQALLHLISLLHTNATSFRHFQTTLSTFACTFCTFFRRNAEQYFPWHVSCTIHTSSHPNSQPRRLPSRYPDSQSSDHLSRQESRHPDSHPTEQKSTRKPTNHSDCIPTVQEVSSPHRIYLKMPRYQNIIQEQ